MNSKEFSAYRKRYIAFLKENGLYAKNKVSLMSDGFFFYKDKNGFLTKFV